MPRLHRIASLVALCLAVAPVAHAAGPMFTNTFVAFPGMTSPSVFATGDINGDGIADLVFSSSTVDSVYVLLGVGDGLFGPPAAWGTAPGPRGIAIGDATGDGAADILVACYSGNVISVLRNIGGSFGLRFDMATASGPTALLRQDVTNDGIADVVVTCRTDNVVSVFVGSPSGTLNSHVDYATGVAPVAVAAADFNLNGRTDLVVANSGGSSLSVLMGFGGGVFTPGVTLALPQPPTSVGVGDFAEDGWPDVVASVPNQSGNLSFFRGLGDGTFRPATLWPLGYLPGDLAVADCNVDGHLDVTYASTSGGLGYTKGLGDGTFVNGTYATAPSDPTCVRVLDANADGIPDLAGASASLGTAIVTLGTAVDKLGNETFTGIGLHFPSCVQLADFDGDGVLDLAASSYGTSDPLETGIAVGHGHGDGTFGPLTPLLFLDSVRSIGSLAVADVTGDGVPDLVGSWTDGSTLSTNCLAVLAGHGDGTFSAPVGMPPGGNLPSAACGDLDADGLADIVTTGALDNQLWVVHSDGGGTFAAPVGYPTSERPFAVVLADVDQDGVLDALVTYGSNAPSIVYRASYSVFHGLGDGTFAPRVDYTTSAPCFGIASGDFNEDGIADVVTLQAPTKTVSVELGGPAGSFGAASWFAPVIGSVYARGNSVRVADLNADGHADIVLTSDTWIVTVFLGTGSGTFEQRRDFGRAGGALTIGDVNGDLRPDLVAGGGSGVWSLLQQNAFVTGVHEGTPSSRVPSLVSTTRMTGRMGALVRMSLRASAFTRVDILDIRGRVVRALFTGMQSAGVHEHRWDGRTSRGATVPAGVYIVRVQSGSATAVTKLVIA